MNDFTSKEKKKKNQDAPMQNNSLLSFLNNAHYQIYYTPLARALKSVTAAIVLSELIQRYQFHETRNELETFSDSEGWFYHTIEAMEQRLALSRKEQDTAIRILKEFNLIETKLHGLPARRFFRINITKIFELIDLSNNFSSLYKTDKLVCTKGANRIDQKGQSSPYIEEPNEEPNEEKIDEPQVRLSSFFLNEMKKINPKINTSGSSKWKKSFELMISRDGHTEQEIQKVIQYLVSTKSKPSSNGFCWANVILSPDSLRKNFAKLWAEMGSLSTADGNIEKDKELAEKIKQKHSKVEGICIGYNYIEFIKGSRVGRYVFGEKDFSKNVLREVNETLQRNIINEAVYKSKKTN